MARRTIDQLYALTIPEVQQIFLSMMQDAVDRAILDQMVIAIENNDVDALFRASGFTPAVLSPILDRIEQVYKDAADITVDGWPKRIRTPTGLIRVPMFNPRNPVVEQELRNWSSQWITRITDEARENVREVLQQGMINGDNPRRTALDIVGRVNPVTRRREGGVIGLTENQTRWALSARRYLEQLDTQYFTLTLRDKRFDSMVRSAIESGKPLSEQNVSKLVTAYKTAALRYRGEAISRTETMQAINRGEHASIVQGIEEGLYERSQIKKWWDDVGDGVTRNTHRELGRIFGRERMIDLDEPFVTPRGARLMYPGDQSMGAPAEEIVNCRCKARYRIDFVAGLLDE